MQLTVSVPRDFVYSQTMYGTRRVVVFSSVDRTGNPVGVLVDRKFDVYPARGWDTWARAREANSAAVVSMQQQQQQQQQSHVMYTPAAAMSTAAAAATTTTPGTAKGKARQAPRPQQQPGGCCVPSTFAN